MITKEAKTRQPNKTVIKHHADGGVLSKTRYKNEKKHGIETWWWKNGGKEQEITWNDFKLHGVWIKWYESGNKYSQTTAAKGEKHGVETEWYDSAAKYQEAYYFRNKDYARIQWDEKGNITKASFSASLIHPLALKKTKFKNHTKPQTT